MGTYPGERHPVILGRDCRGGAETGLSCDTPPDRRRGRVRIWSVASMLLLLGLSAADAITLAWNPSARAVGYRLHYGERSRAYDTTLEIGAPTQAAVGGLTPGHTYFFAVTAYDAAGESAYSNEVSSVIPEPFPPPPVDTTPPSAAITSPADGATVPRKGMVMVDVSASDDVGVTQVRVLVNGQQLCVDAQVPYRCTWNVPAPPGRTYRLQAEAFDAAGNGGQSAVVTTTAQ
jgi:chitinase